MRLATVRVLLMAAVGVFVLLNGVHVSRVRAAASATVVGRVYWDANGNGAQDGGEPGLDAPVELLDDAGVAVARRQTDAAGDYRIEVAPGVYRVRPNVARRLSLCVDSLLGTNSPFPAGGCYFADFPITSPESSDAFTVAAGETRTEDFAVTAKDQMVIVAHAVEEDHYGPAGGTVTARVRGKACGSAVLPEGQGGTAFALYVEGASSVAGCAAPGDTVQFELNGRTARESLSYKRFVPGSLASTVTFADMVFATDWMWLWSDNLTLADGRPVPVGTRIVARIGEAGCGLGTNTSELNAGGSTGFAKLLVPSERISTGCGKAGARVDLVAILSDRDEVIASFPWEPGVKQIGGPGVPPPQATPTTPATAPATPTSVGEVTLPGTGGGGTDRGNAALLAAVLLSASGVAAMMAGAVTARRRT